MSDAKWVVLYTPSPDVATLAPVHMPAHQKHYRAAHERGELLMIGTFGDPFTQGSMCILDSEDAAKRFAAEDPFVVNGVVQSYEIRRWDEILT